MPVECCSVDFAVDANVLRVMTRLGWLKEIGIFATEGVSIVDRRAAQRGGGLVPYGLNNRGRAVLRSSGPSIATEKRKKPQHSDGTCTRVHVALSLKIRPAFGIGFEAQAALTTHVVADAPALVLPKRARTDHHIAGGGSGSPYVAVDSAMSTQPEPGGPNVHPAAKRRRCGSCIGCRSANCGVCSNCKDMPKFGGAGTKRQSCSNRKCIELTDVSHFAFGRSIPHGRTPPWVSDPRANADLSSTLTIAYSAPDNTPGGVADRTSLMPAASHAVTQTMPPAIWSTCPVAIPELNEESGNLEVAAPSTPSKPSAPVVRITGADEHTRTPQKQTASMNLAQRLDVRPTSTEPLSSIRGEGVAPQSGTGLITTREAPTNQERSGVGEAGMQLLTAPSMTSMTAGAEEPMETAESDALSIVAPAIANALATSAHESLLPEYVDEMPVEHHTSEQERRDDSNDEELVSLVEPMDIDECPEVESTCATDIALGQAVAVAAVSQAIKSAEHGSLSGEPMNLTSLERAPERLGSVNLASERYRSAKSSAAIRVVGAERMYCRKHSTYHVCDWTRRRSAPDAPSADVEANEVVPAGGGPPDPLADGRGRGEVRQGSQTMDDIEDLPRELKRFSKKAQMYMHAILPKEDTPDLNRLLYRAHVFMITHGAILCGETPQCSQCPLRPSCEYGSLLYVDGKQKAGFSPPTQPRSVSTDEANVANAADAADTPVAEPADDCSTAVGNLEDSVEYTPDASMRHPLLVGTQEDVLSVELVQNAVAMAIASAADGDKRCERYASRDAELEALQEMALQAEAEAEMAVAAAAQAEAAVLDAESEAVALEVVEKALSAAMVIAETDVWLNGRPPSSFSPWPPAPTTVQLPPHPLLLGPSDLASPPRPLVCPTSSDLHSQMVYAREVHDSLVAPQHPGDATPRLLLLQGTIGDYAKGRLLLSPWSAFKGVFPMHGTYFAQNEVFEDESAGEVRLPLATLGRERRIYLGKSIEGVLRRRTASELGLLFRESFVCIRRFRSTDGRLLPLVLDAPRLLKHKATPSELALHLGLARPLAEADAAAVAAQTSVAGASAAAGFHTSVGIQLPCKDAEAEAREVTDGAIAMALVMAEDERQGTVPAPVPVTSSQTPTHSPSSSYALMEHVDASAMDAALRLFALYVAAGGALCMRPAVWRKIMTALHPDRGGDVHIFQHITALKRKVDEGEEMPLASFLGSPRAAHEAAGASSSDVIGQRSACNASEIDGGQCAKAGSLAGDKCRAVYDKVRAELWLAAQRLGGNILELVQQL